ncbi:hypothetical protein [Nitrospira sp. KM1]|nr:hypothetical protein [Nitrospira sp. KM1]
MIETDKEILPDTKQFTPDEVEVVEYYAGEVAKIASGLSENR